MINIIELLKSLDVINIHGKTNRMIKGIYYHSNQVKPDSVFIAISGFKRDGHDYIKEAISNGAIAIIRDKDIPDGEISKKKKNITDILVSDSRKALALAASKFYDYPSKRLRLIGVTGTNGKTTVSYLIDSILRNDGFKVGVIGTISYRYNDCILPAPQTTPESLDLQYLLRDMVDNDVDYCILEASSHSLELQRLVGCEFHTAIFTNLGQDHLDFHKNQDIYFEAKAKLFREYPIKIGIINIDDPYSKRLLENLPGRVMTYSVNKRSDVIAEDIYCFRKGISFTAKTAQGRIKIKSPLLGQHNVYNILAAIGTGICHEMDLKMIKKGIEKVRVIPGRFEKIEEGQDFMVAVDFAHTEDALKNLLQSARNITKKRLILVFGCGGDRDRLKRPLMGRVAARFSDFIIITSDNPRTEDPMKIIEEIEKGFDGMKGKKGEYIKIKDREEAITRALKLACPGDFVLIAGKGHEPYQIIGNKRKRFDDREIVRKILRLKKRQQKYG